MAQVRTRLAAAALALAATAGLLGPASPAQAATSPAHSLTAARTHAPVAVGAVTKDALTSSTQQNWYRVVLTRTGFLSVVLGDLPRDYNLALYDAAGTRLVGSDHAGTLFEDVDRSRVAPGTYFLRVASTSGSSSTEYALGVRFVTAAFGVLSVRTDPSGRVVGEFVNNTAQWQTVAAVDVVFRTASGVVLKRVTKAFLRTFPLVPPFTRTPFEVLPQTRPAGTTSVAVVPRPSPVADRVPSRFTLSGVVRRFDTAHDRWLYTGTVTNGAARATPFVDVLVRGYDRRGVLVGLGHSIRIALAPGARGPVTAEYDGYRAVTPGATLWTRVVEVVDTAVIP